MGIPSQIPDCDRRHLASSMDSSIKRLSKSIFVFALHNGRYGVPSVISCGDPPPSADNATVTVSSNIYGGMAVYSCKEGFTMETSSAMICGGKGDWMVDVSQCSGKMLFPIIHLFEIKCFMDNVKRLETVV